MFPLIRLFPQDSKIDFLGFRRITLVLSLVLILGSVGMFFSRGLNLGIDFKGGLLFDLRFSEAISIDAVKDDLSALGYGTPEVQAFGFAITLTMGILTSMFTALLLTRLLINLWLDAFRPSKLPM